MRRSFAIWASVLVLLVSGCTSLTEDDLADLQSHNSMIKKAAIGKLSERPGVPLKFMGPLLKRTNEEKAVNILLGFLDREDEPEDTQIVILKALLRLCKTTEVPSSPLIEKLNENKPRIRRKIIEVLARSKSRKALPALMRLLDEEKNKYVIIWALGEIGDPRAIPRLNQLLASADKYEKYNANRALEKIEREGDRGGGSSAAIADGSAISIAGPPSSEEREKVQVDKASDSHGSGKFFAKAPDRAISKAQDVKSKKQQARQIQIQRAGEKEKRSQQPLAVQRKQFLQALAMQRSPQKTAESAGTDPTKIVALASKETKAPKEAANMVLAAQVGQKEDTKKVKQTARQGTSEKGATLYLDALAYHREGSLQKAKRLYEAALKVSPDLASAWNNLGAIYMKEKNYSTALRALQKALRIKPNYVDPYYNLACLYASQDNIAQSLSYLKKAVSVDGEARNWAMTDADLKNLHGDAEYEKIIRKTRSS
jgi:HEAT repeat protein/Tfp pilus assembly protein PilF